MENQGGKYRIDRLLGQGGFGNTYSGYNTTFDEHVAIKEFFMQGVNKRDGYSGAVSVSLAENVQQFEEQREKFKKEALRIRKLNNSHIIKVHDLFEENGTVYYVMDFVDGESLAERLKRTGKPLSVQEVEMILPQILDALKTVHEASIWHLDLKPANIMIDKSGNVTLIDFGASKQLNVQKGGATTSTAISYTNGYAPRDLGATLYTLLSNKRPSLPTDIDDDVTEDKHIALPLPTDVINTKIQRLILWMMSTNRNLRPQCVEDILAKLEEKDNEVQDSIDEETLVATPKEGKDSIGDTQKQIITKESHSHSVLNKPDSPKSKIPIYFVCGFFGILIAGAISAWIYSSQQQPSNPIEYVEEKSNSIPEVLDVNFGEAKFTDGRKYKGYFIKGVLSGQNSYFRYPNGDVFEGTFKDNSFYEGKYTIAEDGSYFSGTFKNGQPDKGTWYDKNNKIITE